jgi:hypothetical protein
VIRYGAVAVRDVEEDAPLRDDDAAMTSKHRRWTSAPRSAIEWIHEEVTEGRGVAVLEAETIVQSLAASMHAGSTCSFRCCSSRSSTSTTTHPLNVAVLAVDLPNISSYRHAGDAVWDGGIAARLG